MTDQGVAGLHGLELGPRADGVLLAETPDGPYDVLVEGERIWSFNPHRDAKPKDGGFHVPWPPPLVRFMNGHAHFSIVEHNDGSVLFDGDVQIGAGNDAIRVVDGGGHPLSIGKTGHLGRSFGERDQAESGPLMEATKAALALLNEKGGVHGFLAFGGLLGAVRDGRLIGHDVDLDLGYIGSARTPADAGRESFQLERVFKREGWDTWRFSAADFKVRAVGVNTAARWIDIFGGFVADGIFYLMPNVAVPEDQVNLLPLGEVVLEGHSVTAPADPPSLLEATYGPGWKVPDPSFKYVTPRSTVRRLDAWTRVAIAHRGHWLPFYEGPRSDEVPTEQSAFAEWTASRLEPGATVIDLGCGNGRDTVWFAEQGFDALGLDYVPSALRRARMLAKDHSSSARFEFFNLLDARQVLARGAQLRRGDTRPAMYARFTPTALNDRGRANMWLFSRMVLRGGGKLYLEFRSGEEHADAWYEFGKHFRKFLSPSAVAAEIEKTGGTVEFQQEGSGMAVYKDEDPTVCRMVASW